MNVKPKNRIIIGYCRVSSHKQKDDLERQIEIIDNTEESEQQELVEDLVQIITVFSCKLQGKRANKAKKLIRELMQEETDGKSHKNNVDPQIMYNKLSCFSTQVLQDLLITGLWAREKKTSEKVVHLFQIRSLEKEFTRLRNSDEYAWLLNVSNN